MDATDSTPRRSRTALVLLTLVVLFTAHPPAAAQSGSGQAGLITIYSNLGPASSYQCCMSWAVIGSGFDGNQFGTAMAFTVPAGGGFDLGQIDIGVNVIATLGTASVVVQLRSDAGGRP